MLIINDLRKAEQRIPTIDLLPAVDYRGERLDIAIFRKNSYRSNLEEMGKQYFHSRQFPNVSFRPAKTQESIAVVAYSFREFRKKESFDAKRDFVYQKWLQAGPIVKTQDGVFTNTTETDESRLKQLLEEDKKVNGIYLLDNGIAFAPYESFTIGVQDVDTFTRGGLARALEHTPEKVAPQLREISSPKFYMRGVDVWNFDPTENPVAKVVSLDALRYSDNFKLHVFSTSRDGDYGGYAFGLLM